MIIRNRLKAFLPVILLFIFLNVLFFVSATLLSKWEVDKSVLLAGNLVLFTASFISYLVALNGLNSKNPHAFVRSVYSSIFVKFFFCILAALVYIMAYRKELNKPALFTCMALYLVYTFVEISVLTKSLKPKTNAGERSTD